MRLEGQCKSDGVRVQDWWHNISCLSWQDSILEPFKAELFHIERHIRIPLIVAFPPPSSVRMEGGEWFLGTIASMGYYVHTPDFNTIERWRPCIQRKWSHQIWILEVHHALRLLKRESNRQPLGLVRMLSFLANCTAMGVPTPAELAFMILWA